MKMNTKKIIDTRYAINYLVKEYGQLPRVEDAVIPLKLHLFWHYFTRYFFVNKVDMAFMAFVTFLTPFLF